jgi:small-conductance mechanosensitive channel
LMAVKLLAGLQTLTDQFFTEFEVPEKDILNPDLIQEAQVVQQIQQKMQEMGQQLQQAGQQNQQLGQQLQQAKGQLAAIQGGGMQGPPMAPQAAGPPPMAGPPGMGGPPAGPQI